MHRFRLAVSRERLATTAFVFGALAVSQSPCSASALSAHTGSSSRALPATSSGWSFHAVCDTTTANYCSHSNYVTGINATTSGPYITFYYIDSTNGKYYSFKGASGTPWYDYTFTPVQCCGGTTTYSTVLEDLSDTAGDPHIVGYGSSPGYSCSTCGLLHYDGTWTVIQDPNEGSGPCAVTEVEGINDSKMGVGFYEKNKTGSLDGCYDLPFEFYLNAAGTAYEYVDMTPSAPPGQTLQTSEADGINGLGDVAGTLTTTSGNIYGWFYSELEYNYFSISSGGSTFPTYALGLNWDDTVVGDYTDGGTTYGFLVTNPEASPTPSATTINFNGNSNVTAVRSINLTKHYTSGLETYTIGGWYQTTATSAAQGFVARCSISACSPPDDAIRIHGNSRPRAIKPLRHT